MQQTNTFQVYNASAGSGKTFTLVKEYLKIILNTNDIFRFQRILAITFTNKAAAEMKARVLENLKEFSKGNTNDMFVAISNEIKISEEELQQRSTQVLNSILQNYSAFNITTIDAFTHRIIRNFSFDLGLSLNFEVEMDVNSLLEEAVDLLISKIGFNNNLTKVLIDYSLDKIDDDKSWDIATDLKEFAKILLNENDTKQLKKLDDKTIEDFTTLKKELQKRNKIIEKQFVEIGKKGLEIIDSMNLKHNDFYRSMLPNHFKNLAFNTNNTKFFDDSTLRKRIKEEVFYAKSKSDDIKTDIESILPKLLDLYTQSEKLYQHYILNNLVLKSIIPLAVLKHINESLNEIKEQNNIRLNAEFNQLISEKIKDEPTPFIYERLGEKFRYYFIDEMQDTSILQWQNLIPLIENALVSENEKGERGNLMLVGDAKQAIYRWRGGEAAQFIDLSLGANPFSVAKTHKNLETNFRSFSEIIDFNNAFFTHISAFLNKKEYQELYVKGNKQNTTSKKGGFVQISFVNKATSEEKELVFPEKTLQIIENIDSKFSLKDICILVRKKKEGIAIANYLSEKGIPIISSETLLLKNNKKVDFIINFLSFLSNQNDKKSLIKALQYLKLIKNIDKDTHAFLSEFIDNSKKEIIKTLHTYNLFFDENELIALPFYNGIEYILRSFNLTNNADAYLFSFLDTVLTYQQKKDNGINGFLEYWHQKKENLCITTPKGENAVQIMTIHKSKGLEFPVVIYPYDLAIYNEIKPKVWYNNLDAAQFYNFETTLINATKKISYISEYGKNLYENRRKEIELDNLNLLYVALTRPVEQLYIITEKKKKVNELLEATSYSDFFVSYLKNINCWDENKEDYEFGNKNRIVLQETQTDTTDFFSQQTLISSAWKNHNISIVENASKLWDTTQESAINYGNLIHKILSEVQTKDDVESVLFQYILEGVITKKESEEIKKTINKVVAHPLLGKYYAPNVLVFNEREIITNNKELQIPDRVVVIEGKATIIDYKTGKEKASYKAQLKKYKNTLTEIGYDVESTLLIYIDSKITIQEI